MPRRPQRTGFLSTHTRFHVADLPNEYWRHPVAFPMTCWTRERRF